MALEFHDGFETGGADAWSSTTGSPTFTAGAANTGNYGMRCNSSGSAVGVSYTGSLKRATFYLYIASAPTGADAQLTDNGTAFWSLYLTTAREIDLYYGATPTKKADGTTVLNTGQWYRISISADGTDTCKVFIDGNEEHSDTQASMTTVSGTVGILNTGVTADLYFDDYARDQTASTADLGNIKTLAARPNAEGTDQNTGTGRRLTKTHPTPPTLIGQKQITLHYATL
jgi:hypothetical protein